MMLRSLVRWIAGLSLLFLLGLGLFLAHLHRQGFFALPDLARLHDPRQTSKIFDQEGRLLREYCAYCREVAPLDRLGDFPAFAVAAEDHSFWKRRTPVSLRGVLRALWQNLQERRLAQGASTISQQLARIVFAQEELRQEVETRSLQARLWRKGRELWIAFYLEHHLPREEILDLYLNNVYCGEGRYGVLTCSHYYFQREPAELNPAETALIVGLFRSPSASPFADPHRALGLRTRVLQQLAQENLFTSEAVEALARLPLPKKPPRETRFLASHFTEFVRRRLITRHRLVDQGLRIHSTLNYAWNQKADRALRESMSQMKARNPELADDLRGAAVLIDAATGAIRVWVQAPAFEQNQFLLDQIRRQTGSAFKPFFYAAWIERGGRLSCEDQGAGPCQLDDSYETTAGKSALAVPMGGGRRTHYIQNFPYQNLPRYRGMIPALLALAESRNAATMSGVAGVRNSRAALRISKDETLALAARLGVRVKGDPGLTAAIGSVEASLLEMAEAWTGFLGARVDPYATESVEDPSGRPLSVSHDPPLRVLEEKTSLAILRGLRAPVELPTGTARPAKAELGLPIMGKTGTATDPDGEATDNWFVGCSPSYCMGVWIGRAKKLPLKTTVTPDGRRIQETGGRNALPVFIQTLKEVYRSQPADSFPAVTDPLRPFVYQPTPPEKETTETTPPSP